MLTASMLAIKLQTDSREETDWEDLTPISVRHSFTGSLEQWNTCKQCTHSNLLYYLRLY